MKQFFITGTDTGIGKTLAAAVITKTIQGLYWKPIQSGVANEISDCKRVQQLTDLSDNHFIPSNYQLAASLSPHQAAALEGIDIDVRQICKPIVTQSLIIEGAGGVFVPLNHQCCMLDLIAQLAVPIIIVTRGTLGTINHTLLTIEALRQRCLNIHGVVFSGELHSANQLAIEQWGSVKTLFHIPYFHTLNKFILQNWMHQQHDSILGELS